MCAPGILFNFDLASKSRVFPVSWIKRIAALPHRQKKREAPAMRTEVPNQPVLNATKLEP
jgi:hypothetical protein